MATIIIDDESEDIEDGSPILEACERLGVPFSCQAGNCATCVIVVREGMENLEPLNQIEKDMRLGSKERLACQAIIREGTVRATW
ncbi:MAG: (2Fe-2S)-binding protein [Candidatus Hydrogenedentes bacterium]|nr:(2Fe-2S)-binding protein [Candidatus Hydrogenedentota bacterium]